MAPDAPTTCPICGAAVSHDSQHYPTIRLTARVFECGGAICIADGGRLYPALACPKSAAVIGQLRADNVRLGDRNVLLAIAMQGAIEALEQSLRGWQAVPLDDLPTVGLLNLSPLRAAYDELVDALEGATPAAAAPNEPARAISDLSVTAAGARSACSESTAG